MRIAPLFLTLLKRYLGLKHLLTFLLDLFAVDEVLSGLISGRRLLPSLSVIIELSISCPALLSNYVPSEIYSHIMVHAYNIIISHTTSNAQFMMTQVHLHIFLVS